MKLPPSSCCPIRLPPPLLPSSFILLPFLNHTGPKWEPWVTQHLTTIGEIQRVTGLDFLPKMSAPKRAALENFKAPALWPKE